MNAQEFWNQKIMGWEEARYSWRGYLNPASWSVKRRLHSAAEFINSLLRLNQGIKIFELGCGSGQLLQHVNTSSIFHYEGWDVSDVAIQLASERFRKNNLVFKAQDLESAKNFPSADVTILLGVTDWISEESLKNLLMKINSPRVLISYTEQKRSLRNHVYAYYRRWKDSQAFTTTLYTENEFVGVYQKCGWRLEKDLSTRSMSPGRLLCLEKNISI